MRARTLVLFLLANVAIRLWFFWSENSGLTFDSLSNTDEKTYLTFAREVTSEGLSWFWRERSLSAPPGLTLCLAALGSSVLAGKIAALLMSSFTLLPVVAITRRLSPGGASPEAQATAAVMFTLGLPLARTAPTLLTEPGHTFFVASGVAMAMRAGDEGLTPRQRRARWVAAGALVGVATSFRTTTLFLPLLLVALALAAVVVAPIRRRLEYHLPTLLRGLAAFTVGLALVVGPVLVKNGVRFGTWKMALGVGAVMYLGADPKTDGHEPFFHQYNFDLHELIGLEHSHLHPKSEELLVAAAREEMQLRPGPFFLRRLKWPLRYLIGQPVDAFFPADSLATLIRVSGAHRAVIALWTLVWRVTVIGFGLGFLVARWRSQGSFVVVGTLLFYLLAFLSVFVIPRYSIPILPLLIASAAAWFDGRRLLSRSTLAIAGGGAALAVALASWRTVFPRRTDPADYAEHTLVAAWPDATGSHQWTPVGAGAEVVVGPEGQSVLCGPGGLTLEADAPPLGLENNQIVLFPVRARAAARHVPLQLFWATDAQSGFDEQRSTLGIAFLGGWADVSFRIPAEPGVALTGLRLDTGDEPGVLASIRPAQLLSAGLAGGADASERTSSWGCNKDCMPVGDDFETTGRDPYFSASAESVPLTSDLRVAVSMNLTAKGEPPTVASGKFEIHGGFHWRASGQSGFLQSDRVDFSAPVESSWTWVHLNPSLFRGIEHWKGELEAVRLTLRCSSYRVLDIGTLKLLKDYRMIRSGR